MKYNKVAIYFDGDIVVHKSCWAAAKKNYFDKRHPPEKGGILYPNKKEIKADGIPEEYIEFIQNQEPLENVLRNCNSILENEIEAAEVKYNIPIAYSVFLTGNSDVPNFRSLLYKEYKANRKDQPKPPHYLESREHLKKIHGAIETQGCEADDYFGQAVFNARKARLLPIIASDDKDLKQFAGEHYNLRTREFTGISHDEAKKQFWEQMIKGDVSDNITGLYQKSDKYIEKNFLCGRDWKTNEDAKRIITKLYEEEHGDEWEEKYNINCDLLWIWRKVPDECPFKTKFR